MAAKFSDDRQAQRTARAEEYEGKQIHRFEMPGIKAVHYLLHDHLDRGKLAASRGQPQNR
jgi:hypothetical protein